MSKTKIDIWGKFTKRPMKSTFALGIDYRKANAYSKRNIEIGLGFWIIGISWGKEKD